MHKNFFLISLCLFLFSKSYAARGLPVENNSEISSSDSCFITESTFVLQKNTISIVCKRPHPFLKRFREWQTKNRKLTAAVLAFPFPFGIVGLHRIYLGCAPYVPVVYIASFGGGFGLLPLIDFCCILAEKNTENFVDNKKVFMWIN